MDDARTGRDCASSENYPGNMVRSAREKKKMTHVMRVNIASLFRTRCVCIVCVEVFFSAGATDVESELRHTSQFLRVSGKRGGETLERGEGRKRLQK